MNPDIQRFFIDHPEHIAQRVREWRTMPSQQMRLICGELTANEIRTVRAILNLIISPVANPTTGNRSGVCASTLPAQALPKDALAIVRGLNSKIALYESAITDALMHLDTNYCIDGKSMKDSDAATALRRVLPNVKDERPS